MQAIFLFDQTIPIIGLPLNQKLMSIFLQYKTKPKYIKSIVTTFVSLVFSTAMN